MMIPVQVLKQRLNGLRKQVKAAEAAGRAAVSELDKLRHQYGGVVDKILELGAEIDEIASALEAGAEETEMVHRQLSGQSRTVWDATVASLIKKK
jgi:chromosome segregation ATPase